VVSDATFAALADDPAKVAALRRARFVAVAARNSNALTRSADVVLPAASLSEKEGTFTNVQGRVQRFERAFLPKPPVRAHWELLLMLAVKLGWGDRNWTPPDLLAQIAKEIEAYGEIREKVLEGGALLKKGDFAWAGHP
jgi:predicted molibdopterin-dependent oxidoreductase YjgC